jgi:magnesium-protoporphyrin O-methyltransferase
MSGCCDPSGYRGAFNRKTAERSARSFARRGLDSTAGPMVAALREAGLAGASVLEIGAGAGTALTALLEAGAVSATAVDMSPNYEGTARALFDEHGIGQAVVWHTGDVVALAGDLPESDVVFLNRVVCCYPDMVALVDTATGKSRHYLAMAYPRRRLLVWLFIKTANAWLRLNRNSFRIFLHDPAAVADRARSGGLTEVAAGRTPAWHWRIWERTTA